MHTHRKQVAVDDKLNQTTHTHTLHTLQIICDHLLYDMFSSYTPHEGASEDRFDVI